MCTVMTCGRSHVIGQQEHDSKSIIYIISVSHWDLLALLFVYVKGITPETRGNSAPGQGQQTQG